MQSVFSQIPSSVLSEIKPDQIQSLFREGYIETLNLSLTLVLGLCQHLYAEPLGSWVNYLNTIKPFGEYPSLAAAGSEKTLDFSSFTKSGLVFDEAGNAIFSYRGREIN